MIPTTKTDPNGLQSLQTALDYSSGRTSKSDPWADSLKEFYSHLKYDSEVPTKSYVEKLRPQFEDSMSFLRAAGSQAEGNASAGYSNRMASLGLPGAASGVVGAQARLPYEKQAIGAQLEFDQASTAALIKQQQMAYDNRRKLDEIRLNYAKTISDYNLRTKDREQGDYQFQTKFNQSVKGNQQQNELGDYAIASAKRRDEIEAAQFASQLGQPSYKPGYITSSGPLQTSTVPGYGNTVFLDPASMQAAINVTGNRMGNSLSGKGKFNPLTGLSI